MWMSLLTLLVAHAAEPSWVTRFVFPHAAGPPADRCPPPLVVPPAPRAVRPEVEDIRTRGMVRIDLAPGAANAEIPADLRAHALAPADPTALPAVPVEGAPDVVRRIREVLARAATRPVRVAMWGDSLTAADRLPSALRRALQATYGDAGRGFVLPAAPWPAWNPVDLERCSTGLWHAESERTATARKDGLYGPGGVSLEASEAEATSWMQTPAGLSVSRFEVAYLAQPGGGRLRAQVDSEPPLMVATAADTVGPGLLRLDVPDGRHRLTLTVVGDGPVRIFGVTLDRDTPGVVVDGMGVGGSTAGDWAKWSEPLMAPFLARRPPELVLLAYGTNDSAANKMTPDRYRAELRAQLETMRRQLPDAACVLVTPADRGQKVIGTTFAVWSPLDWVIRIQEEEAPAFGCATWSMRRAMGGVGSAFGWRLAQPPLMGADLLHPTPAGYEELGRRLAAALMAAGG